MASAMSVLVCFDQSVHSMRLEGPNVQEYLSVLVLPINEKTVSVDLLVYFSILYTLNSVLFWGLTPYNNCHIHAKNVWLQLHVAVDNRMLFDNS